DVTAWSLGLLFGVDVDFMDSALSPSVKVTRVKGLPRTAGQLSGSGHRFGFDYKGADTAIAINRLLKDGSARVAFDGPSHVAVTGVSRGAMDEIAKAFGLSVT